MKKRTVQYFILFTALFMLIGLACGFSGSAQDDSMSQTQMAVQIEQTMIALDKISLTEAAQAAAQSEDQSPDLPAPPTNTPQLPPTNTPEPTNTPKPVNPVFTASETMFCRSGPGVNYLDHWMVYEDQSYTVFAKWHLNDWLVVEMDDPGTRTKCCWIGGEGQLNVPPSSIQEIDYLPDRMTCEKPSQDVKVWDYNIPEYTTLSCGQIAQSEWYFCNAGSGEYCTDVNYDNSIDYLVFKPDADAVCNLPGDFFKP